MGEIRQHKGKSYSLAQVADEGKSGFDLLHTAFWSMHTGQVDMNSQVQEKSRAGAKEGRAEHSTNAVTY